MAMQYSPMLSRRAALGGGLAAGAAIAFTPRLAQASAAVALELSGNIAPVHDPCAIRQGDTYYLFSTHLGSRSGPQIPWRYSKDLRHWLRGGEVLPGIPDWAKTLVPGTNNIWAPDISFYDGKYWLYYACSTFGKNRSVIGLATNLTLDPASPKYRWQDQGLVLKSDFGDDFNAIDANHAVDRQGRRWLSYGSFWSGLKLVELDRATGKPHPSNSRVYSLARRPEKSVDNAIEAPFIISRGDFYYLFASFDFCCRGADSNYYTVVGRARDITGPYGDANNYSMMSGNAVVVLKSARGRWRGPGGCSILCDADRDYIVYHVYDARRRGAPTLQIAPLVWSDDGWPKAIL